MRRTDLSLDEEIAEVEGRLSQRRLQLRALSDEARSRISVKSAGPVALVAALAVGFAASRFVRKPAPRMMTGRRPPPASRVAQIAGAIASILLPRLIGPLQSAAAQWLHQRMRRSPS
jgi:hypothetical protein